MTTEADVAPRESRAITYTWVALCVITIGAWWLAPGNSSGTVVPSVPITAVVIGLGFIKSRLIIRYFMEVRTGPRWLKQATDAWLFVLWGAVLAIYLF